MFAGGGAWKVLPSSTTSREVTNIIADGWILRDAAGKNGKGDPAYLLHLDGFRLGRCDPPWLDVITLPI